MLHAFLLGLVAGARSLTPLAAVSDAARRGLLPDSTASRLIASPIAAGGLKLLAAGELAGDKLPSAPDRIVPAGMAARMIAGALVGAAVSPRGQRGPAAVVAMTAAAASAYLTFGLRIAAMRRYGQTTTGVIEDAAVLAATGAIMRRVTGG
jgi:uncharacterized membrane protein